MNKSAGCISQRFGDRGRWISAGANLINKPASGDVFETVIGECIEVGRNFINGILADSNVSSDLSFLPPESVRLLVIWMMYKCARKGKTDVESPGRTNAGFTERPSL